MLWLFIRNITNPWRGNRGKQPYFIEKALCHAYCMAQNQAKCQTSCESLWLCYPKTPRWDSCDEIPLPSRGLPTNLWVHHWRWMWSTSLLVLFTWCHGRQMTKLYKIPQDLSNCKRWFNLPFFGLWNYLVAIDLRTSNRGTVDKLQAFDPRIQFCRDVIRFVFFGNLGISRLAN